MFGACLVIVSFSFLSRFARVDVVLVIRREGV